MNRIFFCDGACSTNGTWNGGYGVVELDNNIIKTKFSEQEENTTNNRMEMKAMIYVLREAASDTENVFTIYTDSAYVCNMCNQWIWGWSQNGWKNSKKVTVENLDLVLIIYELLQKVKDKVEILKVKGHNGQLGNEIADALAQNSKTKLEKLIKDNNLIIDF